jgi:RHS repeat-associated protein
MPQRSTSSGSYRYGFNGKENDNDVKGTGNQQDYGERIYDNRLARFLSTDPLTKSYPMLTPYQFASNSPIWMIDLDGLEGVKFSSVWNGRATLPQFIQNPDIYGTAVESAASLNRTINPGFSLWNYGVKLWTGTHDYDGNPIDAKGRAGVVTDMGVETMQWMTWARFFKALPNASTPLEQKMAQNARATGTPPAKPAQSQALAAEAETQISTTAKPAMQPQQVQQWQSQAFGGPLNKTLYRGGSSLEMSAADINNSFTKSTGLMKERGISVNTDKKNFWIQQKGGAFEIDLSSVPKELKFKNVPEGGTHFEITPHSAGTMTKDRYQELLKQIVLKPYNKNP